jgi:hypothetical protein
MLLRDWLASGDLQQWSATREELDRLFEIARRDRADAALGDLSLDRRFATAYEAALALATVVLRASGYRTRGSSSGHHWLTFALLTELMGPEAESRSRYLQACRRKRHQATYERAGVATQVELRELLAEVRSLQREVSDWLRTTRPDLTSAQGTP